MTTVARLLPRHWDGRRLLQFLAGLALIALAFALPALLGPAAPPAGEPATIITTVDTPLPPGLPVITVPAPVAAPAGEAPAAEAPAGLALEADTATAGQSTAGQSAAGESPAGQIAAGHIDAGQSDAGQSAVDLAGTDRSDAPGIDAGVVQGQDSLPVQQRPLGRPVCVEARGAGGAGQRTHGERGPPQA